MKNLLPFISQLALWLFLIIVVSGHAFGDPVLRVQIDGAEYASGDTFDFGTHGGQAGARFQLRNEGASELIVSSWKLSGDAFELDGNLEGTLEAGENELFPLFYESEVYGVHTGTITINSNDPENEVYTIHLQGETVDPNQPITISEARKLPQGTEVTVSGWVTVSNQFAGPVYFQDETGGIAWYNGEIMRDSWNVGALIGDSIVVTGEIGEFNNLLQIVEDTYHEVYPESNMIQEPLVITLEDLNSGDYEAMLVQVTDLEFEESGIFSGGTNYVVYDDSGQGQLRVDNFTNIPGAGIPNSLVEVTAIAGRFRQTHQLLPRFRDDFRILSGPIILTAPPYEASATDNSITLEWETEKEGHSEVRYGTTSSLEMGRIIDDTPKTDHSVTLSGLNPATVYKVQLRSALETDTSYTELYITSTASPEGATGEILTWFNKSVAHEVATYREADQDIRFEEKLIEYVDQAEETADFTFYNISGDVGEQVVDAIIDAHERGVEIRVLGSGHTGSTNPLIAQLADAGIHAVQGTSDEQMHNKFAVIDAHHDDPSRSWLITSSWNATDHGSDHQFQNMVVLQDVALARAYWLEFNQMWGAESGSFNAGNARYGEDKSVVNPSVFWLGQDQTMVEVYFSPQANTEAQINRTLSGAEESIDLGLNIITRRAISNTMLNRHNQGVKVRGVIGTISGQGNEFEYLSSWADVHHFPQSQFGLLHHKYAIVDGEIPGENSRVITGSHNWSANANFRNDENTLIIHNPRVANEFFQEFAARYWQAGGEDQFDVPVSVDGENLAGKDDGILLHNYPNPFGEATAIKFHLDHPQSVSLDVYDMTGRRVAALLPDEQLEPGVHEVHFNASGFPRGIYLYRLQLEDGRVYSGRMSLVR